MKDIEKQAFFTVSPAFLSAKFKRTSTSVAENRAEDSIAHLPKHRKQLVEKKINHLFSLDNLENGNLVKQINLTLQVTMK